MRDRNKKKRGEAGGGWGKLPSFKGGELTTKKKEKGRRRFIHCLFIFSQEQTRRTTCNPPYERKLEG